MHAYLDDLVIFSSTWEEHLEHLSVILTRLKEAGLSVKPSKCQFAVSECVYLGHVIGGGRVMPVKDKLEAINSFPVPVGKKMYAHSQDWRGTTEDLFRTLLQ